MCHQWWKQEYECVLLSVSLQAHSCEYDFSFIDKLHIHQEDPESLTSLFDPFLLGEEV